MFSEIDSTIFPDECEVLEIVPHNLYVYPIFKNGSSSLFESMNYNVDGAGSWKKISGKDVRSIASPITVFLRDPKSRFVSGVNTYVQHLKRTDPKLDEYTALWFVDQYLFLNRHFCPQFFWLINLARYIHPDVPLKLEHFTEISKLTSLKHDAEVKPATKELQEQIANFNWKKLELYFYLDQVLLDHIGQEFTFRQLMDILYTQHHELHQLIFESTLRIADVLPKV